MTKHTSEFQIGPVVEHGRTKTAARDAAVRSAAQVLNWVDEGVELLSAPPGCHALVAIVIAPSVGSWCYQWLEPGKVVGRVIDCGFETKAACRRAAVAHAVVLVGCPHPEVGDPAPQHLWKREEQLKLLLGWVEQVMGQREDMAPWRKRIEHTWRFENLLTLWASKGVNPAEAHDRASRGEKPA